MKINSTLGLAIALTTLGMSPVSDAATESEALDACVKALVSNLEQESGKTLRVNLGPRSNYGSNGLYRRTVFHLDAADSKTGKIVARADCTVSRKAEVVDLKTLPLKAKSAERRSRSLFPG